MSQISTASNCQKHLGETKTRTVCRFLLKSSWRTKYVDWILIKWQSFPLLFYDTTEISNKSILRSPKNGLVIFTFKVSKGTYWLHSKTILKVSQYYLLTKTPSFEWSFQDGRQLTSKPTGSSQTMSCSIQSYFSDQWLRGPFGETDLIQV